MPPEVVEALVRRAVADQWVVALTLLSIAVAHGDFREDTDGEFQGKYLHWRMASDEERAFGFAPCARDLVEGSFR